MTNPEKITSSMIKVSLSKRHSNDFYLTEVKTGSTWFSTFHIIDAMAMNRSWKNPKVVMYEVKVNRGDFLKDKKYLNYLPYCNEFYFACVPELIQRDEIEPDVGLIYSNGKSNRIIKKALYREQEIPSEIFQYIIMNRLGEPDYPFFNDRIEYFRAWLERKKSCKELAYKVESEIFQRLSELEGYKEKYERIKSQQDELIDVFKTYDIHVYGDDLRQSLKKLLTEQKVVPFNPNWFLQKVERTIDDLSSIKDNLLKTKIGTGEE